jgi:MFS superfamily sulfate permease-like transporter
MPIARWIPVASWLPADDRSWLGPDLLAGVSTWALVVPQAVAYGAVAGLSPQAGLAAAFAGPLAYAVLGTSRQLMLSPTSSTAAISAALAGPVVVRRGPGLIGTVARTAVVAGTATAVSGAPDQELIALGGANALSGLLQAFMVAGGASQSAGNDRAGARSQVARPTISVLGQTSDGRALVDLEVDSAARPLPGMLILRPNTPLIFLNVRACARTFSTSCEAARRTRR